MGTTKRPYFIWDYDLTDADIREILRGDDAEQRAWIVARLQESARYEDIWQYISFSELQAIFPKLQLKPQVRASGNLHCRFGLRLFTMSLPGFYSIESSQNKCCKNLPDKGWFSSLAVYSSPGLRAVL